MLSFVANSLPSYGSGTQGRKPAISRNFLPLPSPGHAGQGQLFQGPPWTMPRPTGPEPPVVQALEAESPPGSPENRKYS